MAYDVFICYSIEDRALVERLSSHLEENGFRCFVTHQETVPGAFRDTAITRAIETCKMALVVFTENLNRSAQADTEIAACAEARKPTLLFKAQRAPFKGTKRQSLANLYAIDAASDPDAHFVRLLQDIYILFPEFRKGNLTPQLAAETEARRLAVAAARKRLIDRKARLERRAARKAAQRAQAAQRLAEQAAQRLAEQAAEQPPAADVPEEPFDAAWLFTDDAPYLAIDLSGGPGAGAYPLRRSLTPPCLTGDTCRTTELWLRLIPPGTFLMGSPADEPAHKDNELLHEVTLTKPFYIGIFQVTQKQYELVAGANPSAIRNDTLPVINVSYEMLRGNRNGAEWPTHNRIDAGSFFAALRTKTELLADLPTEAQWEYACRAGTVTGFNSGKPLTASDFCPNMNEVGRYRSSTRGKKKKSPGGVLARGGLYLPNAWGLYDMHGNVYEWCLDWEGPFKPTPVTDPKGALPKWFLGAPFGKRVQRGGSHLTSATACRSAHRHAQFPNTVSNDRGFRAAIHIS
ncbi:MAG: SUMF1/EgtB/PvdO family nonheme iron enzyme [Kiritimatiellaeota bacterium]|nr:SUMF1/EgtB/PvdO family nonheme iron enzyme [Kiritimatiellota bacterium]